MEKLKQRDIKMARYSVWTKVTLDFEIPVEATSYNEAALLAEEWNKQQEQIIRIIKEKRSGFNGIETEVYGVFKDK